MYFDCLVYESVNIKKYKCYKRNFIPVIGVIKVCRLLNGAVATQPEGKKILSSRLIGVGQIY